MATCPTHMAPHPCPACSAEALHADMKARAAKAEAEAHDLRDHLETARGVVDTLQGEAARAKERAAQAEAALAEARAAFAPTEGADVGDVLEGAAAAVFAAAAALRETAGRQFGSGWRLVNGVATNLEMQAHVLLSISDGEQHLAGEVVPGFTCAEVARLIAPASGPASPPDDL